MDSQPSILMVADRDRADEMQAELRRQGVEAATSRVDTAGRFMAALRERGWDVILHQNEFQQMSLYVELALLLDGGVDIPIVVVGNRIETSELLALATDERVTACTLDWLPVVTRQALRETRLRRALAAEAEDARQRERRYLALMDRAPGLLYVHDRTGRFILINSAVERLTGYRREEVVGRNFAEFIAPEYLEVARRGRTDVPLESPVVYEVEIVAKDGSRVPLEVSSWLVVRNGVAVEVHGVGRDLRTAVA